MPAAVSPMTVRIWQVVAMSTTGDLTLRIHSFICSSNDKLSNKYQLSTSLEFCELEPDSAIPCIQDGAVVEFGGAASYFSQQEPRPLSTFTLSVPDETVHKSSRELLLPCPHAERLTEVTPAEKEKHS